MKLLLIFTFLILETAHCSELSFSQIRLRKVDRHRTAKLGYTITSDGCVIELGEFDKTPDIKKRSPLMCDFINQILVEYLSQKKFQQDYSLPGNFNSIFELEVTKKINGKDKSWKIRVPSRLRSNHKSITYSVHEVYNLLNKKFLPY